MKQEVKKTNIEQSETVAFQQDTEVDGPKTYVFNEKEAQQKLDEANKGKAERAKLIDDTRDSVSERIESGGIPELSSEERKRRIGLIDLETKNLLIDRNRDELAVLEEKLQLMPTMGATPEELQQLEKAVRLKKKEIGFHEAGIAALEKQLGK